MEKLHIDHFSSLDDIRGRDRGNPSIVLCAIMKNHGRFSAFDASDNLMAHTLTAIMKSGWVRSKPVGYPWVEIELTDAGRAQMEERGARKKAGGSI